MTFAMQCIIVDGSKKFELELLYVLKKVRDCYYSIVSTASVSSCRLTFIFIVSFNHSK